MGWPWDALPAAGEACEGPAGELAPHSCTLTVLCLRASRSWAHELFTVLTQFVHQLLNAWTYGFSSRVCKRPKAAIRVLNAHSRIVWYELWAKRGVSAQKYFIFASGRLNILASKPNATCSHSSIVRFAYGPKRPMGHVLGAEKGIFLIRRGRPHGPMAAAPMESCQSLPKRSPWGRLGSV